MHEVVNYYCKLMPPEDKYDVIDIFITIEDDKILFHFFCWISLYRSNVSLFCSNKLIEFFDLNPLKIFLSYHFH